MSLLSCSSFDLYCILSYYCFAMIELIKMDGWMDGWIKSSSVDVHGISAGGPPLVMHVVSHFIHVTALRLSFNDRSVACMPGVINSIRAYRQDMLLLGSLRNYSCRYSHCLTSLAIPANHMRLALTRRRGGVINGLHRTSELVRCVVPR